MRGLGMRLDVIYPADAPHTALLSAAGRTVRLTTRAGDPEMPGELAPFVPQLQVTRASGEASPGRAGMRYRDLIPGRLGGRYIASHITIAEGGPVADWVHFHHVAVQMIFVASGWVRVVYEGQGDPFVMHAGDLVLQPPEIRHRVLESSAALEVVEIGCPALHETLADHDLDLPDARSAADRDFSGQRFLRHIAGKQPWTALDGVEVQETGMAQATAGLAIARIIRPGEAAAIDVPPHDGELVFGFIAVGSAELDGPTRSELGPGDAFVIPPGVGWSLSNMSPDCRVLHVTTARLG